MSVEKGFDAPLINKPTVIIAEFIQTRRAESQLPLPDDLSIIPDRTLNHVAPQTLTLYIKFNIVFFFFFLRLSTSTVFPMLNWGLWSQSFLDPALADSVILQVFDTSG